MTSAFALVLFSFKPNCSCSAVYRLGGAFGMNLRRAHECACLWCRHTGREQTHAHREYRDTCALPLLANGYGVDIKLGSGTRLISQLIIEMSICIC